LREDAKDNSETPCELSGTQKNGEALAHSNVLASSLGVFEMFPSTGHEHDSDHDAQEKKRDVCEPSELWKNHPAIVSQQSVACAAGERDSRHRGSDRAPMPALAALVPAPFSDHNAILVPHRTLAGHCGTGCRSVLRKAFPTRT